jgi:release factor glutamine methyltransferase
MSGSFRQNHRVIPVPSPPEQKTSQTWTILEVLRWTVGRFERHGIESARLDAELLATRAFARTRVELYTHYDQPLAETELASYRGLVQRRLGGEPVAYILGHKEFWSLDLEVDPRVLIPRPDTETLVEQGLALLAVRGADGPACRVADIGTGSGAVALALKKERSGDEVFAVDLSGDALEVARQNASRLGLAVTFLQGDLLAPLAGAFDLVVSNPPYIPTADIDGLAAEVRKEPRPALDGGKDGLAVVTRLARGAPGFLANEGWLAIEIGSGQAEASMAILRDANYRNVGSRRDLAGIERVVFGQRGLADGRSPT